MGMRKLLCTVGIYCVLQEEGEKIKCMFQEKRKDKAVLREDRGELNFLLQRYIVEERKGLA
jgi:hypothetical protein